MYGTIQITRFPRAGKAHGCDNCGGDIVVGEPFYLHRMKCMGDDLNENITFRYEKYHQECHEAELTAAGDFEEGYCRQKSNQRGFVIACNECYENYNAYAGCDISCRNVMVKYDAKGNKYVRGKIKKIKKAPIEWLLWE